MRLSRISEHQKDLLILIIFPISLLLIGLVIAWLQLGLEMFAWLKSLRFQLTMIMAICTLIGLIAGKYELKIVSKYLQHLESASVWPVDRRGLVLGYAVVMILCVLFYLLQYLGTSRPQDILVKVASFSILGGLGFSVMFGIIFICASVARIMSQ